MKKKKYNRFRVKLLNHDFTRKTVRIHIFEKEYNMKTNRMSRMLALALALIMVLCAFTGCGKKNEDQIVGKWQSSIKFSDVMEKAFYNTVLAGMQEDGKRFFYVNPLEVIPGIAGVAKTHTHDLPQRPTWYACACCPPNVSRLITSFGKYAYGENKNTVFCHLFAAGWAWNPGTTSAI